MKKLIVSLTTLIFFSVGSVYAKSVTLVTTGFKNCDSILYKNLNLKKLKIKVSGVEKTKGLPRKLLLKTRLSGQSYNLQYVKRSGGYQYSSNTLSGRALFFTGQKGSVIALKKLVIRSAPGCTDTPTHQCWGASMKFMVKSTGKNCTLLLTQR